MKFFCFTIKLIAMNFSTSWSCDVKTFIFQFVKLPSNEFMQIDRYTGSSLIHPQWKFISFFPSFYLRIPFTYGVHHKGSRIKLNFRMTFFLSIYGSHFTNYALNEINCKFLKMISNVPYCKSAPNSQGNQLRINVIWIFIKMRLHD